MRVPVPASLPLWLSALAVAGFVITLDRVPVPWTDEVIYAAIARGVQIDGAGAPTTLDGSPAIDHVGFYGPVFFGLAAAFFDLFGVSAASFRAPGLVGALVLAAAGAWLARVCGQPVARQRWTAALLLLTPEIGRGATEGRMDTLAVGWSLLALTAYARGTLSTRPVMWGALSGLSLSAAALTVPRSYPFVAVFVGVAFVAAAMPATPRAAGRQWAAAAGALGLSLVAWAWVSHGSVLDWARFHWYVASREDIEVATAPGALRRWSVTPWQVVTSLAAAVGAVLVLAWREPGQQPERRRARHLVLAIAIANGIVSAGLMNLTFALGIYFAVILLAVVLAIAPRWSGRRAVVVALCVALLTSTSIAVRLVRYARVAATWPARDPRPIERFIARHVPPGSYVYGPDYFFFYAVERAGSRYLAESGVSAAGWTRLVPPRQPARLREASRPVYVIRLADEPEPACAGARTVARFEPPPTRRRALGPLGWVAEGALPDTYRTAVLSQIPPGCRS